MRNPCGLLLSGYAVHADSVNPAIHRPVPRQRPPPVPRPHPGLPSRLGDSCRPISRASLHSDHGNPFGHAAQFRLAPIRTQAKHTSPATHPLNLTSYNNLGQHNTDNSSETRGTPLLSTGSFRLWWQFDRRLPCAWKSGDEQSFAKPGWPCATARWETKHRTGERMVKAHGSRQGHAAARYRARARSTRVAGTKVWRLQPPGLLPAAQCPDPHHQPYWTP